MNTNSNIRKQLFEYSNDSNIRCNTGVHDKNDDLLRGSDGVHDKNNDLLRGCDGVHAGKV